MYDIETIDQLIEKLGGDTVVAGMFDISQPAVANWKVRGQIAAGWHLRLLAISREKGLRVSPAVFGLGEKDAAALFCDAAHA